MAQDTAHAAQSTGRAHRLTGAKWSRTPHTQHKARSEQNSEQEPTGPGHHARSTTHRAGKPVNRSQVAQDTANTTQNTKRAHRRTGAKSPRTRHTTNATHRASTAVNRSQEAQDTAHAAQHTEGAHRRTGAKWPWTPHTRHNTPSRHTGEQEPRGPEQRNHHAKHRVNRPGDTSGQ